MFSGTLLEYELCQFSKIPPPPPPFPPLGGKFPPNSLPIMKYRQIALKFSMYALYPITLRMFFFQFSGVPPIWNKIL